VLAALALFLPTVLPWLVLATSPLFVLAALALLLLLLLAFFLGFGAHAVLGLVGVFVCHGVTPL
jgi:hypothetical protein